VWIGAEERFRLPCSADTPINLTKVYHRLSSIAIILETPFSGIEDRSCRGS
jgi:hypothetical protein